MKDSMEIDIEIMYIYLNEEEYKGDDLVLGIYLLILQSLDSLMDLEYQRL